MKIRSITFTAFFTALTVVLSQILIYLPFTPLPISLSIVGVLSSGVVLGSKQGFLSQIIYILLGIVGLPVFAKFNSGIFYLAGPTGGYIIGYILASFVTGYTLEKMNKYTTATIAFSMFLGLLSCYLIGSIWLAFVLKTTFLKALSLGVIPFIIGDTIKIALSSIFCNKIQHIKKSLNN